MEEEQTTVQEPKRGINFKGLLLGALVVLLAAGIAGGVVWYLMDQNARKEKDATDKAIQALENSFKELRSKTEGTENQQTESTEGTIEGSLGYPSGGGIPSTMTVYAVPTTGGKTYSTTTQLKNSSYKYGVGYKLNVPSGQYYVYGKVPGLNANDGSEYKAYYNKFVTCGLSVECKDYSNIAVTVSAGKTTSGIDIFDWYPTK